jgi:hypothetical protein
LTAQTIVLPKFANLTLNDSELSFSQLQLVANEGIFLKNVSMTQNTKYSSFSLKISSKQININLMVIANSKGATSGEVIFINGTTVTLYYLTIKNHQLQFAKLLSLKTVILKMHNMTFKNNEMQLGIMFSIEPGLSEFLNPKRLGYINLEFSNNTVRST